MTDKLTFKGYVRTDGNVGIRNRLLIIGVDECVDGVCRAVAADFKVSLLKIKNGIGDALPLLWREGRACSTLPAWARQVRPFHPDRG